MAADLAPAAGARKYWARGLERHAPSCVRCPIVRLGNRGNGAAMSLGRRHGPKSRVRILIAPLAFLLLIPAAHATELRVASSAGFSHAYLALVPEFEKRSGVHVESVWGPSMGATHDTIPARLARGEPIDVVIMAASALEKLAR